MVLERSRNDDMEANGINIAKLVENATMDNWLHGSAVRFKAS